MNKQSLKSSQSILLIIAAVGAFTLILKNPDDIIYNFAVFLPVMAALAINGLNPKK